MPAEQSMRPSVSAPRDELTRDIERATAENTVRDLNKIAQGEVRRQSPTTALRDEMVTRRRTLQARAETLDRTLDTLRERMQKLQDEYRDAQADRADTQHALDMVDLTLRSN